jgi:hypothetical protein
MLMGWLTQRRVFDYASAGLSGFPFNTAAKQESAN